MAKTTTRLTGDVR